MLLLIFVGFCVCFLSFFFNAVRSFLSNCVIISMRKRKLSALFQLCSCYRVAVCVLCLFRWLGAVGWSVVCYCDISLAYTNDF